MDVPIDHLEETCKLGNLLCNSRNWEFPGMNTQSGIDVKFGDFDDAARRLPKMKRGPIGSSAIIPNDTLLTPDPNGVMVDTPAVSSFVPGSSGWELQISVEARKLVEICDAIKKIGAGKSNEEIVTIGVEENHFWMKFNTTKLSLRLLRPAE